MTNTNDAASPRDRSPAFPVLPLEAALGKLAEFEVHFKRTPARPDKIGEAWGIKIKPTRIVLQQPCATSDYSNIKGPERNGASLFRKMAVSTCARSKKN